MKQSRMPLFETLNKHKDARPISFHVPGHKNGLLIDGLPLLEFDVTELSGLDDLHAPEGPIAEAEQLLTDYYRSYKSYFLVNGSTAGNLAMILAVVGDGDYVVVQRNCHKSILNGLQLANAKPIFISPEIQKNPYTPAQIHPQTIKEAFERYPEIKACILTYPDYYGQICELEMIIKIVHEHGALALVDEAHGPHLKAGSPFPKSSLDMGADVVIHSAHKMLPAMTMGSYLHLNSKNIPRKRLEFYLSALQSSSPSYPIMASLDIARSYLGTMETEDINYTIESIEGFIKELRLIPGLHVTSGQDPLKLLVRHRSYSGFELQSLLEHEGVFPEMADPYQVIFTLPLLKKGMVYPYEEAIDRIKRISFANDISTIMPMEVELASDKISELALTYKEMEHLPVKWVSIDHAAGRVAGKTLIPYPPGIPLLIPGERITDGHIRQLNELIKTKARFQGGADHIDSGKIAVF